MYFEGRHLFQKCQLQTTGREKHFQFRDQLFVFGITLDLERVRILSFKKLIHFSKNIVEMEANKFTEVVSFVKTAETLRRLEC